MLRRLDFDTGTTYASALASMQAEADAISAGTLAESFWIGEHPLTVTLGRSLKSRSQLLAPPATVAVVEVERGGGATLHNPGQVVVYPLLRIEQRGLSPVTYLRQLEEILIAALAEDQIEARAIPGQTGVWVGERKIASLGVSLIKGVTRHGLALNVTNNLRDFAYINPCGFTADTMVNVAHFNPGTSFAAYKERLASLVSSRYTG
jgi:lipoyl(octanoyl) transferase